MHCALDCDSTKMRSLLFLGLLSYAFAQNNVVRNYLPPISQDFPQTQNVAIVSSGASLNSVFAEESSTRNEQLNIAENGLGGDYNALPEFQREDSNLIDEFESTESPIEILAANIPGGGFPGEDYPVLASVPDTGFDCSAQDFSGYYADTASEAGCQVFHICQLRESGSVQQDSFLCPNGTIFNQQYFVCDWWFNFDCSSAESFYALNQQIGVVNENTGFGDVVESTTTNDDISNTVTSNYNSDLELEQGSEPTFTEQRNEEVTNSDFVESMAILNNEEAIHERGEESSYQDYEEKPTDEEMNLLKSPEFETSSTNENEFIPVEDERQDVFSENSRNGVENEESNLDTPTGYSYPSPSKPRLTYSREF